MINVNNLWVVQYSYTSTSTYTQCGIAIIWTEQLKPLYPLSKSSLNRKNAIHQQYILISSVIASQIHPLSQQSKKEMSASHLHQNNIYRYTHSFCQQYEKYCKHRAENRMAFPIWLLLFACSIVRHIFSAFAYYLKRKIRNQKFHAQQKKSVYRLTD